jgi:hypothetical protein
MWRARDAARTVLNLGIRWKCLFACMSQLLYPRETNAWVSTAYQTSEPIWMSWRRAKTFARPRNLNTIYRLSSLSARRYTGWDVQAVHHLIILFFCKVWHFRVCVTVFIRTLMLFGMCKCVHVPVFNSFSRQLLCSVQLLVSLPQSSSCATYAFRHLSCHRQYNECIMGLRRPGVVIQNVGASHCKAITYQRQWWWREKGQNSVSRKKNTNC